MEKTGKFCFDKRILLVVFFLFIVAGSLYTASFVTKSKTSTKTRAAEVNSNQGTQAAFDASALDASQTQSLADNELTFLKSIYKLYISDTSQNFNALYDNAYNFAKTPDAAGQHNISGSYRALCTQATMTALAEGINLQATNKYVQYFSNTYSSSDFTSITSQIDQHTQGAPVFDCLLAVNLLRNVLPAEKTNQILADIKTNINAILRYINANGGIPNYYEKISGLNYGDSQAEESLITASMLHLAAQLLPTTGPGSITEDERSDYLNKSFILAKWGYSKCGKAGNCSIKSDTGLVVNHMMDPGIAYTLSLLAGYSEIAMATTQLGKPLSATLFDQTLANSLNDIATNLKKYLKPNFSFTGNFNLVTNSGNPVDSSTYDVLKYTIDSNAMLPVSTSIPHKDIDAMSQLVTADKKALYSYTYKGNSVWHFRCDLAGTGGCSAIYQDTLENNLRVINRKPKNEDGWNKFPLPTKLDAFTQYYMPGTSTLKRYVYSGDKVWHYICPNYPTQINCDAQYVMPIKDMLVGLKWNNVDPPLADFDAVSQYMDLKSPRTLKTFIYKGDRVWPYTCTNMGTKNTKCKADPVKRNIDALAWLGLPINENFDAVWNYYSPDGKFLKYYVVRGDQLWTLFCTGTAGPCTSSSMMLVDMFNSIKSQYKWSKLATPGIEQLIGVSDWGMDATVQNSSFSSLYIAYPLANLDLYLKLQDAELKRGRATQAYFPTNYEGGAWNYAPFLGTKNVISGAYLTDGWKVIDSDGRPLYWPAATQDERVNAHWWFNILAAKNHAIAYLLLTNQKLLKQFGQ